jgi:metal-responsive CopG/Arc/MetJ family transcriptional regulator
MKAKIAITIERGILEEVDRMAEEFNLNRSQFIENLLSVGLGDAKALKAVGLMDIARLVIRVKDKLHKRLSKLQDEGRE